MRAFVALAVLALLAPRASAQPFPSRSGETGILDVPDAEASGVGGGQLGVEMRFDHRPGLQDEFGPLPLYVVTGLTERLDLGLTIRESGQPGDPRPSRALFGSALKLQLLDGTGRLPMVAVGAVFDRMNDGGVLGARLSLSTGRALPVRLAAFAGGEAELSGFGNAGPTAGVAASLALARRVDLAAEALTGPRGENFGAALRWWDGKALGVALGANWFPGDEGFRVALTLAFAPPAKPRRTEPTPADAVKPITPVASAPRFLDDRPRFRLRIPPSGVLALSGDGRRIQHGPPTGRAAAAAAAPAAAPAGAGGAKSAAPTLEDLAEAQLREQEPLAAAREARVRAAADQLDEREKATLAERRKLEEREGKLEERELQLAAREKRGPRTPPTLQQRQLESIETQLAFQERQLFAQERSFLPAIETAEGRERAAAAREESDAAEAGRLAAAAKGATTRVVELDLRKQALAAKNRQLAGSEGRLIAKSERVDALERQLRDRRERLDAWERRLDTRTQRLDLREQVESKTPPPAAPPKPAETTAAPKDKPAFVMVVKSPTAIQKTGAAASQGSESSAPAGVAVEKSVVAATVVMFPSSTAPMSELDRETVDNLAKLTAKQGLELLIWARAKDPASMPEAQRRADELRQRAVTAGPLDPKQVVTRVTTRPGAQRVDVVLSALREVATPGGATPTPTSAPAAPTLQGGESGKRQIRDAVVAAQPSIEACVGEHLARRRGQRAEGVLKIQVSAQGRVAKVVTGGDDLAGDELEVCLAGASASWQFPTGETDYAVDVPITVMPGGSAR